MCRIGQNDRCKVTGCEFIKAFDVSCYGFKLLSGSYEYVKAYKEFTGDKTPPYGEKSLKLIGYDSDSANYSVAKKSKKKNKAVVQITKTQSQKRTDRRKRIYERGSGICYLCGESVAFEVFTIEHVIPLAKGGTSELHNLRPAHYECNQKKGDKILAEFLKQENQKP